MATANPTKPEWEQLENELALHHALTALLPPRSVGVQSIALQWLRPNPFQVRQRFHEVGVLAQAMLQHGVRFRLRVRPDHKLPGCYQVAFGERWVRAANRAGIPALVCEVADYSDEELFEIGLAEHIRRSELDPLEEAFAFRTLIEQHGRTIEQLEARIGRSQPYIMQRLRLLTQPLHADTLAVSITDRLEPVLRVAAYADVPNFATAPLTALDQATTAHRQSRTGNLNLRRIAERDLRTMQTIVARWQAIAHANAPEPIPEREYLERILHELHHASELLQQHLKPSHTAHPPLVEAEIPETHDAPTP